MYDFLLVRHCNYSSVLYHFRVIWRWIISWPWNLAKRSFKLVPVESLSAVSCAPSIVTMAVYVAVCELFSVKEWCDLGNRVRGHSGSLKMAPFNRPCTTFFRLAIVTIALSCTTLELFDLNNIVTFKYGLEVTQDHWKWCHSKAWVRFPIRLL